MIRHRFSRLSLLCAAVLAGACASAPPTQYYTLQAQPQAQTAPRAGGYAIEVMPVGVPSQVDVPQLVVRRGPGELALLESHQWAAPLHRELRAALSEQLSAALGVADVYRLAVADDLAVLKIKVNVSRFEAWPGRQTVVGATWSVSQPASGSAPARTLTCTTQISQPVGMQHDELVAGYQRAVQALTAEIAAAVRDLRKSGVAGCAGAVVG
ncbi:MAG TPA: PqiC family protein [Fontimonas sp.]